MRLKDGNFEVVDIKGKKMLRGVDGGWMFVVLPEKLPDRFTLEINFHSASMGNPVSFQTTASPYERSASFGCYSVNAWVASNNSGGPNNSGSAFQTDAMPGFVNGTFSIDNGRGIKGYINEHRTANAPQTHVELTDTLIIQLPSAEADDPVLVSTLRIAAGGKKLYDVLAASGRVATHGILFDTGLDRIRGESTPTLKEIGQMLKEHPELELTIEGHTDNVGQATANLTLSQKRADAVEQYLVATFGIDAARLTTKGYGDTKPADKNDSPQGRQNNRRVELVKSN
jgi:outer membrane protein OmpA-like peptidoglycan-associated protein